MSWFWIAIASVLSGTLGAMGLGGGGILLLVLVWVYLLHTAQCRYVR